MNKHLKHIAISGVVAGFLTIASGSSYALVMDFGTQPTTSTPSLPFSQNGLTMTPLNTGSVAGNHYDHFADSFGSPADNAAGIHTGNNAEEVSFVFSGGAFDLLSVFSEGFLLDPDNAGLGLTVTFAASSGATHTVSDPFVGLIDFSVLTGWTNITSFKISAPLGVGACEIQGNDCSTFGFDDVTFQAHVSNRIPEPGTLALFGLGLAGLGFARRKKAA